MKINRGSREVDIFKEVKKFPGLKDLLDKLNKSYAYISSDINLLRKILLPVVFDVVLCPDNGSYRCAANFFVDSGQLAIFFPCIIPQGGENNTTLQKPIAIGVMGNVRPEKIKKFCQKIVDVFEREVEKIIADRSA